MANIDTFCLIPYHSDQPDPVATDIKDMKFSDFIYCGKEVFYLGNIFGILVFL